MLDVSYSTIGQICTKEEEGKFLVFCPQFFRKRDSGLLVQILKETLCYTGFLFIHIILHLKPCLLSSNLWLVITQNFISCSSIILYSTLQPCLAVWSSIWLSVFRLHGTSTSVVWKRIKQWSSSLCCTYFFQSSVFYGSTCFSPIASQF